MDDRTIMDTLLTNTKNVCDLMMHGSIESPTPNVHSAFKSDLDTALAMQNRIYSEMTSRGWYQTEAVDQNKIDTVRSKHSPRA